MKTLNVKSAFPGSGLEMGVKGEHLIGCLHEGHLTDYTISVALAR